MIIINANALQDTHASSNTSAYNDLKIAFSLMVEGTNVSPFNENCNFLPIIIILIL